MAKRKNQTQPRLSHNREAIGLLDKRHLAPVNIAPLRLLQHYEQIFSKSRNPMSLLDRNYTYLAVSGAYSKFHKMKAENIVGMTVAELIGEEAFRTTIKNHLDRCLAGENIYYQAWFEYPETGRRFIDVSYFPVSDTSGAITGAAAFLHDLTEIKQMECELKQRAQELSEVNKALETLLNQSTRAIVDQENRIYDNLQELVFPYLAKLEQKLEGRAELLHVNVIKANLEKITSSFTLMVSSRLDGLTPRELQVAQLIKQGKLTKDIALLLHISPRTVEFYRDKLRKKLGLKSKQANLRSHLSSLT